MNKITARYASKHHVRIAQLNNELPTDLEAKKEATSFSENGIIDACHERSIALFFTAFCRVFFF